MTKRSSTRETSDDNGPLTSNPFAALAGQKPGLPQCPPQGAGTDSSPARAADVKPSFTVQRTRKGGYPIFLEKRPGGKVVTVIRNVSGDAEALLKLLKKKCGAGGCLAEDGIEIQGDHRERIESILRG